MSSTRFTRSALPTDPPPPLLVLIHTAARWVTQGLLDALSARGHASLTEAHLSLLANLDCGATHASAVAARMGVTRQAMNRPVQEMVALGYLRQESDPEKKNQKLLIMTDLGVRLAIDAREAMSWVEAELGNRIGIDAGKDLRRALELSWGPSPGP